MWGQNMHLFFIFFLILCYHQKTIIIWNPSLFVCSQLSGSIYWPNMHVSMPNIFFSAFFKVAMFLSFLGLSKMCPYNSFTVLRKCTLKSRILVYIVGQLMIFFPVFLVMSCALLQCIGLKQGYPTSSFSDLENLLCGITKKMFFLILHCATYWWIKQINYLFWPSCNLLVANILNFYMTWD